MTSVVFVLLSAPVTATPQPTALKPFRLWRLNVPPRFTLELVALIIPVAGQLPFRMSVPPLTLIAPALAQFPFRVSVPAPTLTAPELVQPPLKISVAPPTESVWLFCQVPLSVSVPLPLIDMPTTLGMELMFRLPPLLIATAPLLINGWALIAIVPPLTSAEIVPWLATLTPAGPFQGEPGAAPIVPFCPWTVIPEPITSVVPESASHNALGGLPK